MNRFVPKAIHSSKLSACALAVAGVFFIGSQAMAQAPDRIFACVNNNSGQTVIVAQNATCPNNSSLVVWNVVGPQGPIGPQGPQGLTGPAGAQGPSNAFIVEVSNTQNITGDTPTNIMTLSLPSGSYVVNATAGFAANTSGGMSFGVQCFFRASHAGLLGGTVQGLLVVSLNSFLTLPVTTAFTLTSSDQVSLACSGFGGVVLTQLSSMVAIQVATLTKQAPGP